MLSVYYLGQLELIPEAITESISYTADNLTHWLISYLYVQASLEMVALLDKDIMLNNFERLQEYSKKISCMYLLSALAIFLGIADGAVAGFNVAMPGKAVKFITVHLTIFL